MANVIFSGSAKQILLEQNVTYYDVQADIYSAWKTWATGNAQYPQALRSAGGDPLPGGKATGRYYFLVNGWKLVPHTSTTTDIELDGNLFSEDGSNIFVTSSTTQLIRLTTSQLSDITFLSGSGGGGGLTAGQASQLTNIENTVLTTSQSVVTVITSQSIAQSVANSTYTSVLDVSGSVAQQSGTLATINTNVTALLSAGGSLTPSQSTMLLEMYRLLGLDPTRPLIVTPTARTAGDISQSITTAAGSTVTVTRS